MVNKNNNNYEYDFNVLLSGVKIRLISDLIQSIEKQRPTNKNDVVTLDAYKKLLEFIIFIEKFSVKHIQKIERGISDYKTFQKMKGELFYGFITRNASDMNIIESIAVERATHKLLKELDFDCNFKGE